MILSPTDIDNLLTDLSSSDAEKRDKAERFYNENKADVTPQLREFFYQKIAGHRRAWRLSRVLYYVLPILLFADFFFISLTIFLSLFFVPNYNSDFFKYVVTDVVLLCLTFLCSAHLLYWRARPQVRQVNLLKQLSDMNDPHLAGYIIDLIEEGNSGQPKVLESILYQQFSTLCPIQLSSAHRSYLRKQLIYFAAFEAGTFDEEKARLILKALEQVGQEEDCNTLRRVQREGYSEAVKDAARECLQLIQLHQEADTSHNTLLRASEYTVVPTELLRPANSNVDTHAETLLRVPREE